MARDPRYDVLFEPVKIGPVTATRTASAGGVPEGNAE